jgi:acyl-homoserine lactone acylase PvdQ
MFLCLELLAIIGLFEQFWRMGLSQNLEEWEAAMAMQQLPIFNTCYADKDGHIMYLPTYSLLLLRRLWFRTPPECIVSLRLVAPLLAC